MVTGYRQSHLSNLLLPLHLRSAPTPQDGAVGGSEGSWRSYVTTPHPTTPPAGAEKVTLVLVQISFPPYPASFHIRALPPVFLPLLPSTPPHHEGDLIKPVRPTLDILRTDVL